MKKRRIYEGDVVVIMVGVFALFVMFGLPLIFG